MPLVRLVWFAALLVGSAPLSASAQLGGGRTSAPISNIAYEVVFDRATARSSSLSISMSFDASTAEPVLLSMPTWTPGAYEVSNFARNVSSFSAARNGGRLRWDKVDYDTWRIFPENPGAVTVSFAYHADSLDNAMAWARSDFAFFNGTNVFLYPEGSDYEFSSSVVIRTESDWLVATGMTGNSTTGSYQAASFHELVDMPVFIGNLDLDSTEIDRRWYRLATYPNGFFQGQQRAALWGQIAAIVNVQSAVFQETPWQTYTTLIVFDPDRGGSGSALEHSNSHVGIYDNEFAGSPTLALITGHEIFHAWNVKRLRPAELVPYEYSRPQQTTLLWMSEGITDYYADLSLIRGALLPAQAFYLLTNFKLQAVLDAGDVALEDASLSTWISPTDGTASIYYEKGSLVGLMLDILIRDATSNTASLDDVLRDLYTETYKRGRGFMLDEWWETVERIAGRPFDDFHRRFIDGREPFPWDSLAPLAGMAFSADTVSGPRLGVSTSAAPDGMVVTSVTSGSPAQVAGVELGDMLVRVGDITVRDSDWGDRFREAFREQAPGSTFDVVVMRDGEERNLAVRLEFTDTITQALSEDPRPSLKGRRIREGILGN
jgi:predicted metalloprotease with PDZ domain